MLHRTAARLVLLSITLFWPVTVSADEPKTADELLARHIEAIGGSTKLDSIKTMRVTGKSSFGTGSTKSRTVIEFKRPQKLRMDMTHERKTIVQVLDGSTGWLIMSSADKPAPVPLPAEVTEMMKDQCDFRGALVDHKKKGHRIELLGKQEVNGSDCYRLEVTKAGGAADDYYLDATSFLIVRVEGKRKVRGGERAYAVNFGDYRDVDSLKVAHSIRGDGLTGDMNVEKVELNVELPDSRFKKPSG